MHKNISEALGEKTEMGKRAFVNRRYTKASPSKSETVLIIISEGIREPLLLFPS